ncbi:hypothetical protein A4A49_63057, partial [Nicotiana attenuata]
VKQPLIDIINRQNPTRLHSTPIKSCAHISSSQSQAQYPNSTQQQDLRFHLSTSNVHTNLLLPDLNELPLSQEFEDVNSDGDMPGYMQSSLQNHDENEDEDMFQEDDVENWTISNEGAKSKYFRENIRTYNYMFSFTSMGGKIDVSVNQTKGPRTFRLFGQNYHQIGSLLPPDGSTPKFAQLYIYDTENEVDNRIQAIRRGESNNQLHAEIVNDLKQMLDEHNVLAKSFRMVRDQFQVDRSSNVRLRLIGKRGSDGRRYNLPTVSEVASLVVGDF